VEEKEEEEGEEEGDDEEEDREEEDEEEEEDGRVDVGREGKLDELRGLVEEEETGRKGMSFVVEEDEE
jgi:hypothetical protein